MGALCLILGVVVAVLAYICADLARTNRQLQDTPLAVQNHRLKQAAKQAIRYFIWPGQGYELRYGGEKPVQALRNAVLY